MSFDRATLKRGYIQVILEPFYSLSPDHICSFDLLIEN